MGRGTDQFWVTKIVKTLFTAIAGLALAGGLSACHDDEPATPSEVPTTVITSYLPDPDEPPVVVSPSTSVSVSVKPSPSTSVSLSPPPEVNGDGPDRDGGDGDRPVH